MPSEKTISQEWANFESHFGDQPIVNALSDLSAKMCAEEAGTGFTLELFLLILDWRLSSCSVGGNIYL